MLDENTKWISRQDQNGIATVTLMRPEKYNALSMDVLEALLNCLKEIGSDQSVKVVILAGSGKAFCAGHDLKEMRADSSEPIMLDLFNKCSEVMMAITSIPQPVIASVQGIATAAGCQLVAACDLAVCSDQVKFATSGINIGLFCSTPMVALTRNVGAKKAFEMLVTGDFISADTALQHGLVNKVVPSEKLDEEVLGLAEKIAKQPQVSIAYGKELFYRQIDAARKEAYDMAAKTMASNMQCVDAQDGIDAFIAKQPMPEWKGR